MDKLIKDTDQLAKQLIETCIDQKKTLVAAESMTGGLLMSTLTSIEDASLVVKQGHVVYSNEAKMDVLGVSKDLIDRESVYSIDVIKAMIQGLKRLKKADINIAISGIAGPKTFKDLKVGTVFIGIDIHDELYTFKQVFEGDRQQIRYQTVQFIFKKLLKYLSKRVG